MDTYKHIQRWTMPESYFGELWPNYYSSGVEQSRDSDTLEESNFAAMLKALGGESETVIVVRERHWAVGWVEWIAIHPTDEKALAIADKIKGEMEAYPVIDEDDWSKREWEKAADYWNNLSPREKVQYAMDARSKYHWLQNVPVWRYGRLSYGEFPDDTIGQAIEESLRE